MRGQLRRVARWRHGTTLALALTVYVPLLLTHRGKIGADTKTYLYLNPGKLLADAPWLWDTGVGLGTVTHQNIGYLWPMGPYYWLCQQIGMPDWIAQRLWLGSILFAAGMGVRFCLRTLNWKVPGMAVAMFAYALTPFVLDYAARLSVILLPYAGLGWLIGFTARSLRNGGWRDPAAFALVAVTVGGVNATSLLLVLIAPALWIPYSIWILRDVRLRAAIQACLRIGALTAVTSVWWVAGLSIQGKYGIQILRYTEAYQVVAKASRAGELLRGLGYWFFYGKDSLGPWIQAAVQLTEWIPVLAASLLVPTIAIIAGFFTRFRHRAYFVLLMLVGMLVSVASHPWERPTPAGAVFKAATAYDTGLAFRSTPRAIPLFVLGMSVLLAAAVSAVASKWRNAKTPFAAGLLVLIMVAQAPLFTGNIIDSNLERPSEIPSWWTEAAADVDGGNAQQRILEMPGIDFASYTWGNTVDPITPGLIDRDYVARELIPYGSPASAALMNALDTPYQEGVSDPAALVPVLQLLGVDDILLRSDLRTGRYRTPRTRRLWHELSQQTPGIKVVDTYGPAQQNPTLDPIQPLEDEMELGTPLSWERPSPVARLQVEDPRPMIRAVDASAPVVIDGDAFGLVNAAGMSVIDPDRPVLFSATYAEDPEALRSLVDQPGTELVVTDTNRKQAWRWGSVRENHGYTERADETVLAPDVTDHRLDVFGTIGTKWYTVAEPIGDAEIDATGYGNAVTYTGGDRPVLAFDGNIATAWKVGAFKDVTEDYLQITWPEPVDISKVHLVQTLRASNNRWITRVRLLTDGQENRAGNGFEAPLGDASRTPDGEDIEFPTVRTRTLRVAIAATNFKELASYNGVSEVGFAEVGVNDVRIADVLRPPTALLDIAGSKASKHPLTYLFRRAAANPEEVVLDDEEWQMRRYVDVPNDRSFEIDAKLRMATEIPDDQIDALVGVPDASAGGITARSKSRLPSLRARAYSALDGDPATAWQSPVYQGLGQWLSYDVAKPLTISKLNLTVVADGHHSVPRRVHLEVDGVASEPLDLPDEFGAGTDTTCTNPDGDAVYDLGGNQLGRTLTAPFTLRTPLTGKNIRVVVDDMWQECSRDWFGGGPSVLPIGIAELGIPGLKMPAVPDTLPTTCRTNLVTIDSKAVGLRLTGSTDDALDRQLISANACAVVDEPANRGSTKTDLKLTSGRHLLETAGATVLDRHQKATTGFSVDLIALRSPSPSATTSDTSVAGGAAPSFDVARKGRLAWTLSTSATPTSPYWIVMGQSINAGWTLTTDSGIDLGPPTLINGYAAGWLVDPAKIDSRAFQIEWAPQGGIWLALVISAVGMVLCAVIVIRPLLRRRLPATNAVVSSETDESSTAAGALRAAPGTLRVRTIGVFDRFGNAPSVRRTFAVAVAVEVLATIAVGPIVGTILAVGTAAALRWAWAWIVLRSAAIASLVLSVAYIVTKQSLNRYGIGFDWGAKFEVTHFPVLFTVSALFADLLIETLRGGWRRGIES